MPRSPTSPSPGPASLLGRLPELLFVIALGVGAGIRTWLSLHDDGIYWPDEVYQSLEPAHRLVFGYGLTAWEFVEGARSWVFPGAVALVLKLFAWAGLTEPRRYLVGMRLVFSALSLVAAVGSFRLALKLGASRTGASVAGGLWTLAAPALYFSTRALSETASAVPIVFGFALAVAPSATRRQRLLAAALMGFAVMLRLQNGVFCLGLLGLYAGRRAWRPLLEAGAVLALFALMLGALDRWTWGTWFQSAIVYLRFNVVEGKSAGWGTADAGYYLRVFWRSMPLLTLACLVLGALAFRRALGVGLTVAGFIGLHVLIPHKEMRFLLPVMPLVCALAGVGLSQLRRWVPEWPVASAVALACALSAANFHDLAFRDVGQYENERPLQNAYDDFGPVNRLLLAAHDQSDLCGLKVEVAHPAWTGGYSYFHRRLPLYFPMPVPGTPNSPSRSSGLFNYVLTLAPYAAGGEVRATEGPLALVKLSNGPCLPDPGYAWRLP